MHRPQNELSKIKHLLYARQADLKALTNRRL